MRFLTSDRHELLEAQGFQLAELTGFDEHMIALYAHTTIGDKAKGDIVLRMRVSNPESLDDAQLTYLARKAFHGMFPWQPGKECVRRTFVDVQITTDGQKVTKSKQRKGCRWCRSVKKRPSNQRGSSGASPA